MTFSISRPYSSSFFTGFPLLAGLKKCRLRQGRWHDSPSSAPIAVHQEAVGKKWVDQPRKPKSDPRQRERNEGVPPSAVIGHVEAAKEERQPESRPLLQRDDLAGHRILQERLIAKRRCRHAEGPPTARR